MNHKQKAFTMIELIITILLTSVLSIASYVFIRNPMISYADTKVRAELVEDSYLLIKKIKRDVQKSLPNSIRIQTIGTKTYLEMISLKNAGKYRSNYTNTGTGDILNFTISDISFDVLSGSMTFSGSEKIVIQNLGMPGYDTYSIDNMANYTGVLNSPVNNISISAKKFPIEASDDRFYVIEDVITYICDTSNGEFKRLNNYTIQSSQPTNETVAPLISATNSLIGSNISSCIFNYDQGAGSRNSLLSLSLVLSKKGQIVNLYGETYVPNI